MLVLSSSALPAMPRTTSALTPSSVRSTSPAFCLSTLPTPEETLVNRLSTSSACCLSAAVEPSAAAVSRRSTSPAWLLRTCALQRTDDLLAALRERLGDVEHPVAERLVERLRSGIERLLHAGDALIEPGGELAGTGGDAVLEALDVGAHLLGEIGRLPADASDQ